MYSYNNYHIISKNDWLFNKEIKKKYILNYHSNFYSKIGKLYIRDI